MIKYRVQATILAERLPALVNVLYEGKLTFDPELKIYPVLEALPAPPKIGTAIHQIVKEKTKRVVKPRTAAGFKRQEVVEATLKTGPKRWSELRAAIGDAGLPQGTLNSLISKWQTEGKIKRSPDGLWSLVQHEQAAPAGMA